MTLHYPHPAGHPRPQLDDLPRKGTRPAWPPGTRVMLAVDPYLPPWAGPGRSRHSATRAMLDDLRSAEGPSNGPRVELGAGMYGRVVLPPSHSTYVGLVDVVFDAFPGWSTCCEVEWLERLP